MSEGAAPVVPAEDAEELYEHAPCGYLSTLPDGTITKVNQTLLAWTGYRREELVGRRRFADLLTAGGRIYHETHYAPLLAMQGSVREIAVELACPGGRRLPVLLNSVLVRDADGAARTVRTAVFDATDRRGYERELLAARQRAEASEERARVLAETLQASLMPPTLPVIPGLEIGAAYRPAGDGAQVGGDFYDVFETGRGEWGVVLGDVCGKGPAAAVVTALARHTVRAAAMRSRRPSAILATLNTALLRQPDDRFCTIVYLRVRRDRHRRVRVTVTSAGHALPLRLAAGGVEPVGVAGSLLGVLDDPVLAEVTVELEPGTALFCYTDGLTEARRGEEFFGDERLVAALEAAGRQQLTALPRTIIDELVDFQRGVARDDMAALVLGVPGGDAT